VDGGGGGSGDEEIVHRIHSFTFQGLLSYLSLFVSIAHHEQAKKNVYIKKASRLEHNVERLKVALLSFT
jgi:hypothetical protein